jgi:hypothetical protein
MSCILCSGMSTSRSSAASLIPSLVRSVMSGMASRPRTPPPILKKCCGPKCLLRRPAACSILDCRPRYSLRRPAMRHRGTHCGDLHRGTHCGDLQHVVLETDCCDTRDCRGDALPCSRTSNRLQLEGSNHRIIYKTPCNYDITTVC